MDENIRIVEINGIKVEVDLRTCKVIEQYKVGDQVKVLKKGYNDSYESFPGVIIGFDDFKTHPSILIAYLKTSYSGAEVEFLSFADGLKDWEICPLNQLDKFFSKADAMEKLQNTIEKKKQELAELEQKKKYFESAFSKYFEEVKI